MPPKSLNNSQKVGGGGEGGGGLVQASCPDPIYTTLCIYHTTVSPSFCSVVGQPLSGAEVAELYIFSYIHTRHPGPLRVCKQMHTCVQLLSFNCLCNARVYNCCYYSIYILLS